MTLFLKIWHRNASSLTTYFKVSGELRKSFVNIESEDDLFQLSVGGARLEELEEQEEESPSGLRRRQSGCPLA